MTPALPRPLGILTLERADGRTEPVNTLDLWVWIEDNPHLTIPQKKLLSSLLRFCEKRLREQAGRFRCFPSIRRLRQGMGRCSEGSAELISERQVRRMLRMLESYGVVSTRSRKGTSNEYELDPWALQRGAEVFAERRSAEQAALYQVHAASRPQHVEPAWLPPIRRDEDRVLVGALVESVVGAVLGRQPSVGELREHSRLVLKLWRDRDCPGAAALVADVERIVGAAQSCQHWHHRWIRGEHVTKVAQLPHKHRHNWTRRVSTILDPQHFETRRLVSLDHEAKGTCGCKWVVGRMASPEAYTDAELERLKLRRHQAATVLWPKLEREMAKWDAALPAYVPPELKAELLDVSTMDRWPHSPSTAWVECAWLWLAEKGAIGRGPPGGAAA